MSFPTAFHEVRFPTDISFGASGGPERLTEIVTLGSGHEERNARWADSRRRFNAGYGVRTLDDLNTVIAFFEERRARLYGFRWRDFSDWKSGAQFSQPAAQDQRIGTGDGAMTSYQLIKTYGSNHAPYERSIAKPVNGSVEVAVGGTPLTIGVDFTVNTTNGILTFTNPPALNATITAGYVFDVPVRFDTDRLDINLTAFNAGDIPDIPLVEIRL